MQPPGNTPTVDQLFNASLATSGPHGGTSIANLKKQIPQYQARPPMQHIPQRVPIDVESCQSTESRTKTPRKQPISNGKIIKKLVNDLNTSLGSKGNTTDNNDSETVVDDSSESEVEHFDDSESSNIFSSAFDFIKEALLLVIIYVILSQSFIKRAIGTYIPQILPSDDQPVSIVGQLIYGGILALVFVISKRLLSMQNCH